MRGVVTCLQTDRQKRNPAMKHFLSRDDASFHHPMHPSINQEASKSTGTRLTQSQFFNSSVYFWKLFIHHYKVVAFLRGAVTGDGCYRPGTTWAGQQHPLPSVISPISVFFAYQNTGFFPLKKKKKI